MPSYTRRQRWAQIGREFIDGVVLLLDPIGIIIDNEAYGYLENGVGHSIASRFTEYTHRHRFYDANPRYDKAAFIGGCFVGFAAQYLTYFIPAAAATAHDIIAVKVQKRKQRLSSA